ncbi:MAG: hypothetical protein ABFD04_12105 [Syntrophomonas sp.]
MKSLYYYSQGYLYIKIGLLLVFMGLSLAVYNLLKAKKTVVSGSVTTAPQRPEDRPTAHLDYSPTAFTVDVELYEHGQRPKKDAYKKNVYDENTYSLESKSVDRDAPTGYLHEQQPAGPGDDSRINEDKNTTAFLNE